MACCASALHAQPKAAEDVLKGSLSVGGAGGEVFTYELHLTEERGGKFTGYAVIYSKPGNDSRAPLTGRIDRAAGTMSFTEQSIDYNYGFESQAVLCLIRSQLKYNPQATAGRIALSGPTESTDYAQANCARGTLSFTADSALKNFFTRPDIGADASDASATSALLARVNAAPDSAKKATTASTTKMPVAVRYRSLADRQAAAAAAGPAPTATPRPAAPAPNQPPPPPTPGAAAQPKPAVTAAAVAPPPPANKQPQPVAAAAIPTKPKPPAAPAPINEPPPLRMIQKPTPPAPKPAPNEPPTITAGTDVAFDWESDTLYLEVWDGGRVDNDQINIVYNNQLVLSRYLLKAEKKLIAIPVAAGETQLRILAVQEGSEPPNTANLLLRDGAKIYPLVAHNTVGKVATIKIRKKAAAPGGGS